MIKNYKLLITTFLIIIMCLFAGCTSSSMVPQKSSENTLTEKTITQSSLNDIPGLLGSSPTGIKFYHNDNSSDNFDIVFIDSNIGWKALYKEGNTNQQNITLYKTSDEGVNWDKITSTYDKNYTIPLETKTGITFLDNNYGWITTITPKEGYIGLFRTTDGGYSWKKQEVNVPIDDSTLLFHTYPPTFFSESDGILLNEVFNDSNKKIDPLVFVTNNKGESWIQLTQNVIKLNIKWNYSPEIKAGVIWSVTYKNQVWQSKNGITWNVLN